MLKLPLPAEAITRADITRCFMLCCYAAPDAAAPHMLAMRRVFRCCHMLRDADAYAAAAMPLRATLCAYVVDKDGAFAMALLRCSSAGDAA